MKFVFKTVTVAVLALILTIPVASRELTLDDCIEIALQNRSSIIIARGAEDLAKANQRWALGSFLPRLSGSYSYSKNKTKDIEYVYGSVTTESPDQDQTSKNLEFGASMTLFDLANFFNYAGARADRAKAHLDVIESEQNLIYSVKISYYAYLANVENVAVQEEAVKRSEEQLKLIESKYELGSAAKSDVLKQKVQYGNDKLSLLTARNSIISSRSNLAYTVGLDAVSDLEFARQYDVRQFDGSLDDALQFGLEHEPSLLAAQKELDASRLSLRSRLSEYLPKLSGYGSLGWSDGDRGDTVTYEFSSRNESIGFQVTWNIFDGFSRERNVTSSKVNRNSAMASLADTKNLVISEVKTAYLEIEQYKEKKSVAEENVDAAEEDLKITQEKYNLGAATILDLLDAQVSLKEAQVSVIQADFDLNLAVAKLENAMGKM